MPQGIATPRCVVSGLNVNVIGFSGCHCLDPGPNLQGPRRKVRRVLSVWVRHVVFGAQARGTRTSGADMATAASSQYDVRSHHHNSELDTRAGEEAPSALSSARPWPITESRTLFRPNRIWGWVNCSALRGRALRSHAGTHSTRLRRTSVSLSKYMLACGSVLCRTTAWTGWAGRSQASRAAGRRSEWVRNRSGNMRGAVARQGTNIPRQASHCQSRLMSPTPHTRLCLYVAFRGCTGRPLTGREAPSRGDSA